MARGKFSADFDGFVQARGASLHRTAVLLTHDSAQAEAVLCGGLARAASTWKKAGHSPEAFVRSIMLRQWLRGSRDGARADRSVPRPSASPAARPAGTMGDPLTGLTNRQRAVTVLIAFHQQSTEQSAASLGVSTRTTAAEVARAQETLGVASLAAMATILADVAESYPPPDPARLMAQIAWRRRARTRRAVLASLTAAAIVITAGVGTVLLNGPGDAGRGEPVSAAVVDADYAGGYGLVEGTPAPFLDGMALAKTEVIDYSLRRKIVSAPDVEDDAQVYAVAYCDLPGSALDVNTVVDVIGVEADGDTVNLSCQDRKTDLSTAALVEPLPRGADRYTVTVPAAWSGAGALHLALYEEADWSTYPFPPFPDIPDLEQLPQEDAQHVIDASTPPRPDPSLDWLLADGQLIRSIEVPVDTTMEITLLTQQPGQLLVALDGVVLTNDGEELTALGKSTPGPWQEADPALRQGFWRGYTTSGYHRYLDSGALAQAGVDITDDTVTVSVLSRGFPGEGWQVVIGTDGGSSPMALAPGFSPLLPEFAHGMRRVSAYEVPTDGQSHEIPLAAAWAEQLTWVGSCGVQTPHQIRTLTVRTPDAYGLIPCASYRNEWASVMPPLLPERSEAREQGGVTLTAPRTGERNTLTVAVYADVPYEEFPFDATDQPSTSSLNLRPVPDEGDIVGPGWGENGALFWSVSDTVSGRDLDPDGQAALALPTEGVALLNVSTRGRGRFQVRTVGADPVYLDGMFERPIVTGRDASPLMYRDGWWTSWTTSPTRWTIPVPTDGTAEDTQWEVVAQGYDDPGSLRLDVMTADSGDDTLTP